MAKSNSYKLEKAIIKASVVIICFFMDTHYDITRYLAFCTLDSFFVVVYRHITRGMQWWRRGIAVSLAIEHYSEQCYNHSFCPLKDLYISQL